MAPRETTETVGLAANYELVKQVTTEYGVILTKLRSPQTGLTVMHVDIEAPLVNGFFALATEATDDFGCPHTLEHLVFLGSEKYPYKGVLDSLANRALAQGTNAWTDTDHTCYTITTAGSEGFLNLLPIYVDHILYPTLSDSSYYTEVHNINGKGEDSGVVYSEMQGRQNSSADRLQLRMQRLVFPEGCGYRSETGGLMECLREIGVEQIRDYHRSYYRPDNLCLVITGKVDHARLLRALEPIEESILRKGPLLPVRRPWVTSPQPPLLTQSVEEVVEFPDEDESMGEVMLAWMGPKVQEYLELKAIDVLNTYLTDSAVSILEKEFVEIEEPLCTYIDFHMTEQLRVILTLSFSNVPTEHLEKIRPKFFEVLDSVCNEGLDMDRMLTVINREKLKLLNTVETNAHFSLALTCIIDFLYGDPNGEDLEHSVRDLKYLETVAQFTSEMWVERLRKYYVAPAHICLLGKPSAKFAKKLLREETERTETQRERLGEEKLKELERKLEEAKRENEIKLPNEIMDSFPIPPASSISFIPVVTARNPADKCLANEVQAHVDNDNISIPYFIQFDHINSVFVNLSLYVTTNGLPSHLRAYTSVFLESFFNLPLNKADGTQVPYEEVVRQLNEDTIYHNAALGVGTSFRELIAVSIKVEASKYKKAIKWIDDMLWNTEFTVERLKIAAAKILNDIPQTKRDGKRMTGATLGVFQFDRNKSNNAATNVLFQAQFLPELLKKLEEQPDEVVKDFKKFREIICHSQNFRIHVVGNILKLEHPKKAFENFGKRRDERVKWFAHIPLAQDILTERGNIPLAQDVLTERGKLPGKIGYVVNMPSIESSFSLHAASGPSRFDSPDIAPLLVLVELLQTMEGIFWKLIRGQGLAYSCSLTIDIEAGLVYFDIYRSPDAFKAFEQAKKVLQELVDNKLDFDKSQIDGAKSSVIFSIVDREETMGRAATESFLNQVLKKVPATQGRDMLTKVQDVTKEDLHRVLNLYLINLFKPEASNFVVVSAPGKVEDTREGFEQAGFITNVTTLDDVIGLVDA